ncbi:hypothetical protein NIIDMKKI_24730 [Mycobacterium kansasii]|uniref:Transmembrane protein n=1 Tax=Mycobacterium kansasii TaxID=1768 RepID=A0A7G1I8J6_MYCKA|nr:hypothetical protein NIIDMKKI_24730 [Mycobacterium kansasii]
MNFFDHQRAARSSTLKLVLLFIVAVVAMVAFIDAAAAVAMTYQRADPSAVLGVVVGVTAVTLLIIAGGMITKTVALRQGGAAVAASVGAVQVDPTSSDPQLRRLVNIVEEMSLASGCRRRACSSWRGARHQCVCRRFHARRRGHHGHQRRPGPAQP